MATVSLSLRRNALVSAEVWYFAPSMVKMELLLKSGSSYVSISTSSVMNSWNTLVSVVVLEQAA